MLISFALQNVLLVVLGFFLLSSFLLNLKKVKEIRFLKTILNTFNQLTFSILNVAVLFVIGISFISGNVLSGIVLLVTFGYLWYSDNKPELNEVSI